MKSSFERAYLKEGNYSKVGYICGRCPQVSGYYATFGNYNNGKLLIYPVRIRKIEEYIYLEFVRNDFQTNKKIRKETQKDVKRNLLTEFLPFQSQSREIQKAIQKLDIEIVEKIDGNDILQGNQDLILALDVAYRIILNIGEDEEKFYKQKRCLYALEIMKQEFQLKNKESSVTKEYMECIFLAYKIYMELFDNTKVQFPKFSIPQDSFEKLILDGMQTLVEYKETADPRKQRLLEKKLANCFVQWKVQKKDNTKDLFEFDLWLEIGRGREGLQISILKQLVQNRDHGLTDEDLLHLIQRVYDESKSIEILEQLLQLKCDLCFPLTWMFVLAARCNYDCDKGRYFTAKENIEILYRTFIDEWGIFEENDAKRNIMFDICQMMMSTLNLVGLYKEACTIFKNHLESKKKRGFFISSDIFVCQIMYFDNETLLRAYSPQKWKDFLEKHYDGNLEVEIPIAFELVRIKETAELIKRKLSLSSDNGLVKSLAYYVPFDKFQFVLEDKEHYLKLMNVCHMNDLEEGNILTEYLALNESEVESTGMFMKSFTLSGENLAMWNLYGDHGKGCKVGIDAEFFRLLENYANKVRLFRMVYMSEDMQCKVVGDKDGKISEEIQKLCEILKKSVAIIQGMIKNNTEKIDDYIYDSLRIIRYLFKRDIFEAEKEIRIMYEAEENGCETELLSPNNYEALKLPVPLLIREIVLGPCMENPREKIPYLAHYAVEMQSDNLAMRDKFRRGGIRHSVLRNRVG